MPRPVWSGTITFGLVNIPVKLYNRASKAAVRFHQLRKTDGCRIHYKKVCASDGEEVDNHEIIRGYEISPERYIRVSAAELDELYPEATRAIEIEDFVKLEQLDPIYFQQSFYLVPDKGAAKSYTLLQKAMENTGRIGIARFVLRNKEYLAALRPAGRALALSALLFHDEIVDPGVFDDVLPTEIQPENSELEMAVKLIESMTVNFDPAKYRDTFRQQLMAFIESKAAEKHLVSRPSAPGKGKVIDIMAALEASLATSKQKVPDKPKRRKGLSSR
jgi:DNA end-binding protein Ku